MTRECLHVINILSDMEEKYNDDPDLVSLLKDGKDKVRKLIKNRESLTDLE